MPFDLAMPRPVVDLRKDDVVLTGDRPTGPLHLGHLSGSLAARVVAQDICRQTVLVADLQALTDHAHDPERVSRATLGIVADYLAVGIDPAKTRIVLQSSVPELAELTFFLMCLTTQGRVARNPTVSAERDAKGDNAANLAFATYPVSQAADILGFAATAVPVGDDQRPMIELAEELALRINRNRDQVVPVPRGIYQAGPGARLPGTDGRKASKTAGNAIPLGSCDEEISSAVRAMVSDASRTSFRDPGNPDATVTFAYLRAFDPDREGLRDLEAAYRAGGVKDVDIKARVARVLATLIGPVRERRAELLARPDYLEDVLRGGTESGKRDAEVVLDGIRRIFGLNRKLHRG